VYSEIDGDQELGFGEELEQAARASGLMLIGQSTAMRGGQPSMAWSIRLTQAF